MANYSWEIRKALKEITFYFVDVERLVDIFEEIPKYKDDSKLPNFQYKN
ncbi:MAG: hypothetical protein LBF15_02830 [Candidatus Peribacteria bacterium]|nr:hypothetical protein [Candidatus Peribacteria bacterium]